MASTKLQLFAAVFTAVALAGCTEDVSTSDVRTLLADACFDQAGQYQGVHPDVLRAIALTNSATTPAMITKNKNGTVNVGAMGINQVNFPKLQKYGVGPKDLQDQCKNIYVGAWYLRQKMDQHGNSWQAIGAYRSETPVIRDQYASQVYAALVRLNSAKQKS